MMLDIEFILSLYRKFHADLTEVIKYQRKLYHEKGYSRFERYFAYRMIRRILGKFGISLAGQRIMHPQLDDIEAEITYLLVREFKPENIVEISPCGGYSTSWILNAVKDNKMGKVYSYDLVDVSTRVLPEDLTHNIWSFVLGDIKTNLQKLPSKIDYLFMDSDHSASFAQWYIQNIFPKLKRETPVSVHDVFHTAEPNFESEGRVIVNWLKQKAVPYFTASPKKDAVAYDKIMAFRKKLNIKKQIDFTRSTPSMIFFIL